MTNAIIQEIKNIVHTYPRTYRYKLSNEQIKYIEDNVDPKVKNYKFAMRVYWVMNDIHDFPKCEIDGNPITKPIISTQQGYYEFPERYRFCSVKCRCKDKHWVESHSRPQSAETIQKRILTNNIKYGGNAPACSDDVVQKMKRTKETKYGNSGFNNHEKAVETLMSTKGVENVSQLQDVKDKKSETCMKNHGVSSMFKDREYIKRKFTEIFGVDNPMKVDDIKKSFCCIGKNN